MLLNTARCTSLGKVVSTVEISEKDWNNYAERTKEALPEKWKVNLLLRMIPKNSEQDTRLRYVHDIKSIQYSKLQKQVFHCCTTNTSGHAGMHIGALGQNEEEDLDLLKKGDSKGKFDGNCNYCLKTGRKAREGGADVCRLLMADRKKGIEITLPKKGLPTAKPKAKTKAKKGRGRTTANLEETDDEEGTQDEQEGDEECGMFEAESDLDMAMLCEECDEDDEDDGNEESICPLDFSCYEKPTPTTTTTTPLFVAPHINSTRSQDEQDIDDEMRDVVRRRVVEKGDESETVTCGHITRQRASIPRQRAHDPRRKPV